jgi:hypothetical protein
MTSPIVRSIALQLHDLEALLRAEDPLSRETPEGNFARFVFETVEETGPVADWAETGPSVDVLRRAMAPDLAAFGFKMASPRCTPTADAKSAWETGIRRLSQREPFTPDRQTFVFRPIEMFGLALGFRATPSLPNDLREWLRRIFETLDKEHTHDEWSGWLYEAGSHLAGLPLLFNGARAPTTSSPTIQTLALRKWLGLAYPDTHRSLAHLDIDHELLRCALLEPVDSADLARASILYQAIRRASNDRLESDLAATWQVGRPTHDAVTIVTNICRRFHQFALQLQVRHDGRPTVKFEDEYDVQDALHALLRLHFDDVRAEEWTPSYAGNSTRMDFLLKREHVVVEAKMTRTSLKQKDVAKELIQDKEPYRSHPDCRGLICFVYDPGHFLANPTALEDDLSTTEESLKTCVIVSPKA